MIFLRANWELSSGPGPHASAPYADLAVSADIISFRASAKVSAARLALSKL